MENIGDRLINIIKNNASDRLCQKDNKIYNAQSFILIEFFRSISNYLSINPKINDNSHNLFNQDIFWPLQSLNGQNKLSKNPNLEFIKQINTYNDDIKKIITLYCNIFQNKVIIIDDTIKNMMLEFYVEKLMYELYITWIVYPELSTKQLDTLKNIFNQKINVVDDYCTLWARISNFVIEIKNRVTLCDLINTLLDMYHENMNNMRKIGDNESTIKESNIKDETEITIKEKKIVKKIIKEKEPKKITNTNNSNKIDERKSKRKTIPKLLKNKVWDVYIGKEKGIANCYSCNITEISKNNFECGHNIAVSNNGDDNIDNLRPICSECNKSMGSMNLEDYKIYITSVTQSRKNGDIKLIRNL